MSRAGGWESGSFERGEISVLHVDDEPGTGELVAEFIEREGDRFSVETVSSAPEGLAILDETMIDCIISDYEMPGQDGIEFLEIVRDEFPHLPFILYTGKGSEEVASEAISAGVTDYLQKEAGSSQYTVLANRVTNAVEQYRARQAVAETEQKLSEIADRTNDVLFMFTGDWSELLFINSAYEDVWGGSIAELKANPQSFLQLIHPDDREKARKSMERLSKGERDIIEYRIQSPEEEEDVRWIRGETKPIFGTDGNVERIVGFTRDITEQKKRERELAKFKNRYQAFVEYSSDIITILDENGIISYESPAVEQILGYESGERLGETAFEYVHPEGRSDVLERFTGLIEGEKSVTERTEYRTKHANGSWVWIESIGNAQTETAAGGYVVNSREITERKQQEDQIRRERTRFKTLFEQFPEPTVAVTVEDGKTVLQGANPAFEEVFGYDGEEVIGESINDLIVPPEKQEEAEEIDQLSREGELIEREVKRTAQDGERHFLFKNIPIPGDTDPAMYGVYVDITEQKQREVAVTALHDAALQFGKADTKGEVYEILVDTAEEILEFALVAVDVLEGDALVQKAWSLEQDNEGYYDHTSLDEDTFATRAYNRGETIVADDLREYEITPADPEYLSALTVPIGEIGTFQTVAREVGGFDKIDRELAELLVNHAREALQRLERAESLEEQRERLHRENDRLETMVGIISHDLRNPLNVAEGRIQLALEEGEISHLETSLDALERMGNLIEDVLTWAREGAEVSAEETSLLDIREIAEICWQNVETGEATLNVSEDPAIIADEARLQQIFENLYRNAVEHGGTDVEIRIGKLEDGFYFEDDGPGIPSQERQKVFEYGYSTGEGGTGFGLNIVKEIVEAHGWEISVTDGSDGGARFEITGLEFAAKDE